MPASTTSLAKSIFLASKALAKYAEAANKQLRSEEDVLNGQLARLEEFSGEPSPPDKATFERLANYWRGDLVGELDHASDELRAKFAEFFDLYITVSS